MRKMIVGGYSRIGRLLLSLVLLLGIGMHLRGVQAQEAVFVSGFTVVSLAGPPMPVLDLAVINPTPSSLTLTWTAPALPGTNERATRYEIRYATTAIETWQDWLAATPLPAVPQPAMPGSAEMCLALGLEPATTYCFVLVSYDAQNRPSLISNCASGTTLSGLGQRDLIIYMPIFYAVGMEESWPPELWPVSSGEPLGRSFAAADASSALKDSIYLPLRLVP